MGNGEYKKVLYEMFDVLGFSDEQKAGALETFKRRLMTELFTSVQDALSDETRTWLAEHGNELTGEEPELAQVRKKIREVHTDQELLEKGRVLFKGLITDYAQFMSRDLSGEDTTKLKGIAENFH